MWTVHGVVTGVTAQEKVLHGPKDKVSLTLMSGSCVCSKRAGSPRTHSHAVPHGWAGGGA